MENSPQYVIEMLHITKEFPGIKANDDRAFEESLGAMSPFEVKNLLVKMAKKGDEGTTRTLLNAGRGNPNWITTLPREAFFLLGAFAMEEARRNMVKIALKNGTVHHQLTGHHGAARVMVAPAPKGTGIIAGGPMRAVFEVMGITDIVAKSHGSSNPYNMVRATLDALRNATTPSEVAAKRGKSVEDIFAA